jgi:hypothetical protein
MRDGRIERPDAEPDGTGAMVIEAR